MFRDYFDSELIAAMRARNVVLTNQEKRVVVLAAAATVFSAGVANGAWSVPGTATPVTDVTVFRSA